MSIKSMMPTNHLILCRPLLPTLRSFPKSQPFTSGGQILELQLQHQSFQWIFRVDFLQDWLLWSPCNPRDSQESSPAIFQKNEPWAEHVQLVLWKPGERGQWRKSWEAGIKMLLVNNLQRRQWYPTPVLLLGKSHGQRSLVGCSPWGLEESDMTERLHFHFSLSCIGEGNGNPLQCSCLANPRDEGAWWPAVYGVAQGRTRLKWLSSSSSSQQSLPLPTPPVEMHKCSHSAPGPT